MTLARTKGNRDNTHLITTKVRSLNSPKKYGARSDLHDGLVAQTQEEVVEIGDPARPLDNLG